jgi:hypothetical protein
VRHNSSATAQRLAAAVALVALAGCTGGAGAAAGKTEIRSTGPEVRSSAASARSPSSKGPRPAPLPSTPFAGQTLVYAVHGFTTAEVTVLTRRLATPVLSVFTNEIQLHGRNPDHPIVAVAVLYAEPSAYSVAAGWPELTSALAKGLVLAASEATLRDVKVGGTVALANGKRLLVTAVVEDHLLGGFEMATGLRSMRPPVAQPASYLLVGGISPLVVKRAVGAALPDRRTKVLTSTANGFLSAADTVLTQLEIKTKFGEFSLRPVAGGAFVPDDAWVKTRIAARRIKQLGVVTCNKAILDDLAAAMDEVTRRGLGATVHSADFAYEGGCYAPRIARFSNGGSVSAHSWGIAVDINVDVNPLGGKPRQDPRLVAIMTAHNFTWGGRWLRPDGAHFEWVGPTVRH